MKLYMWKNWKMHNSLIAYTQANDVWCNISLCERIEELTTPFKKESLIVYAQATDAGATSRHSFSEA